MSDVVQFAPTGAVSSTCSARPLNIMFGTGSMSTKSSGPYLSLLQTAQRLKGRGHGISILGTRELSEKGIPTEWQAFNCKAFPKIGPGSLHFGIGVDRWLRRTMPKTDIMSLESVWLYIGARMANWCVENKVPYMITAHGNFNAVALGISTWKKQMAIRTFAGKLLKNATCYHALNQAEYRAIRDYGINQPVCVVPNGIDMPDDSTGNTRDGIPPECQGRRTCLYLGRLHPIKGLDRLIKAWAIVRPSPDWQLVLAGGDSDGCLSRLQDLVRAEGLQGCVKFAGYVEGEIKAAWLRMADFYVLPSHSEGMPMAALEAMAFGTPALLTDACNLQEAATARSAMVVPSTTEGITSGILDMTSKTETELTAMGMNARLFVAREYDWDMVCSKLESVYEWMIGRAAMPGCVYRD